MEFYEYGLFGLLLVCFIASSLWPLGSEVFVIGFLVLGFDMWSVFFVASIGNVLGSMSTYYIAYLGGYRLVARLFPKSLPKLERYRLYVQRYGGICAFFVFLPFVGDIFALLLGLYRYNQYLAWLFIALGKMCRYALLIALYVVWDIA